MAVRKQETPDPDSMILSALPSQKVVNSFKNGADPTSDAQFFQDQFIAAPVFLSLSMELALKTWWTREAKDTDVPKTHDLLKLFDELPEQTRIRLENSHTARLDMLWPRRIRMQ